MEKLQVAIFGSGNIGTDPTIKVMGHGQRLDLAALVGVDPPSEKLGRRHMADGQEDMIVDVALDLARDRETVA